MRTIDDPAAAASVTFNMTPMIDVVFQLIIFLMLANDMSRREIEDLELPSAPHGREDTAREKDRVIVNLLKGTVPGGPPALMVKGREMTLDEFKQFLAPIAGTHRDAEEPRASELFVLIRADRNSRWQDVQWVMQALAAPPLQIYKVQFATHRPATNDAP